MLSIVSSVHCVIQAVDLYQRGVLRLCHSDPEDLSTDQPVRSIDPVKLEPGLTNRVFTEMVLCPTRIVEFKPRYVGRIGDHSYLVFI